MPNTTPCRNWDTPAATIWICAAALGAALALRAVLEELRGTVVVFGTPGEENLCTKTTLAERGLLDEADAAMMVHPNPVTCASGRTRAVESLQVEFFGRSAHAGTGDRQGINALDAAVACYQKIQAEKTRYPDTNVHGILNDGGQKASVIPGYSSLKYLTRAWDMEGLRTLRAMVERCAAAAAAETGCTYRIHNNEATNRPMLTNERLSQVFNRYLLSFGESELLHQDVTGSTDMGMSAGGFPPSIPGWDCTARKFPCTQRPLRKRPCHRRRMPFSPGAAGLWPAPRRRF